MNSDVMYKGFDIEVAIIPPSGLVFGDVRMYAKSPRGKRIEFAVAQVGGKWLASLSAEQTAKMESGRHNVQLDYIEQGIAKRLPSSITHFDLVERV